MAKWRDKPPSVEVLAQGVGTAVTGTIDETASVSYTLPGGTMGANDAIDIEVVWSGTSDASNKTFKVNFGGTAYLATTQTTNTSVKTHTRIQANNSASAQVGWATNVPASYGTSSASSSSSVDTTSDVTIALTVTLADSADTGGAASYSIILKRAP